MPDSGAVCWNLARNAVIRGWRIGWDGIWTRTNPVVWSFPAGCFIVIGNVSGLLEHRLRSDINWYWIRVWDGGGIPDA